MDRRISIVMITRDRREETLASVALLRALPERPEVLVIDNGSHDGTVQALRARFPDVRVIALQDNLGAAGRNIGVLRAATPYVAFSDDDSWWAPGALARAADLFDGAPRLGLLQGRILVGPEERPDPVCVRMEGDDIDDGARGPGRPIVGFVACGAVVRRKAFLEAGGFERRLGVGGEETLMALDLLQGGWTMRYVPEVLAHHHPSQARDPAARRQRERRNALWSAWLRRPAPVALRMTAAAIVEAARDGTARGALREALRGWRWIRLGRRPIGRFVERQLQSAR